MEREHFEELVNEGIKAIPERFLKKIKNVAILIEDEPSPEQRQKLHLRSDMTLFGLYEGIPLSERTNYYGMVLPDKITIFQRPIEMYARSVEDIPRMVADTVWHEIAHHFGMDEGRVRRAERERKHKK
jgi:predicted Zn-dependent protease with MMP-like domain